MNEMKELEARLRSLALRRPSPAIEKRLFRERKENDAPSRVQFGWLAPVTAALLLACIVVNQHGGSGNTMATNGPLVAMIMSNQSAAAYLPGSFQNEQNIITANTFEWTNGGRFNSSIRSPSGPKGKQ